MRYLTMILAAREADATPATVPAGTYTLYHSTDRKNLRSILKEGLSKSFSFDKFAGSPTFWLADSFEGAVQHALKTKRMKPEDVVVIRFKLKVPEVGLHKALRPHAYTVHEGVPAGYIDGYEYLTEDGGDGREPLAARHVPSRLL